MGMGHRKGKASADASGGAPNRSLKNKRTATTVSSPSVRASGASSLTPVDFLAQLEDAVDDLRNDLDYAFAQFGERLNLLRGVTFRRDVRAGTVEHEAVADRTLASGTEK